jgi:predicted nuclease of predicted toxin-antitoxin system
LSTNLRLLLDESVTDVLAKLIRETSSAINVEYLRELPIRGINDPGVINYARQELRIVVTTETGMNHKTFPVCTHPGIIVLAGKRRHESIHAGMFQRFLLSGHRKEAQDAVTFLTDTEMRVKKHSGEQTFRLDSR